MLPIDTDMTSSDKGSLVTLGNTWSPIDTDMTSSDKGSLLYHIRYAVRIYTSHLSDLMRMTPSRAQKGPQKLSTVHVLVQLERKVVEHPANDVRH